MNTELITLSPQHSSRIRALHHLMPFMSMDDLMEELLFNCSPANILECCRYSFEGPERRRIDKLVFPPIGSDPYFETWDDLVEKAWDVPVYNPADYPEPVTTQTNVVPFTVIK